ncbi:hypothetical protein OIU85_005666 [Salix viminalis]|uniref:Protein kinase domain-containing protein n=1 Tax=Salix viminalis TaxID=40686 RepID=A0A9Q0STA9_SALVM|nr:hypothetical protein OIU85_005666 [Salix viminalis]
MNFVGRANRQPPPAFPSSILSYNPKLLTSPRSLVGRNERGVHGLFPRFDGSVRGSRLINSAVLALGLFLQFGLINAAFVALGLEICRALAYIHNSIGVCHRDIKPQNLLVNPHTHQVKLCDFGSAKVLLC